MLKKIMMIPVVKVAMPPKDQLLGQLEEVLYSGMIAEGEKVYEFEKNSKKIQIAELSSTGIVGQPAFMLH